MDSGRKRAEKGEARGRRAHGLSPVGALLDEDGGDDKAGLDDECRRIRHAVGKQRVADQLDDQAPSSVPSTLARPPVSSVPPTATAAIASSSMPSPTRLASLAELRATTISPAMPASAPLMT